MNGASLYVGQQLLYLHPAEEAETIRAQLESKGEAIGNNGLWIAPHAIAVGLTLVTNNEGEFRRVRGLKIQNWAV